MRRAALALVITVVVLGLPSAAWSHVERPSYWPDPRPDCHVAGCAGGKVPQIRTLGSALNPRLRGQTRVVCHDDSMRRVMHSIRAARSQGYDIRPTDHRSLSAKRAQDLLRINHRLFSRCAFHQIQPAVTASHNNDRVVVMPGLYTEPHSRRQPTQDKSCAKYRVHSDAGDPGALSHAYQVHCPNDANLIAVIGRGLDRGKAPDPPRKNRHGIPNLGPCIRCNLQLEGSGVGPDDVVIEAGDPGAGDGGPSAVGHKKDVGVFVDRADGFVLRNVKIRHAREHDIYVLETDGYRFDRFKTLYAGGYGVLTFVEDHGLISNCEAAGNGDSGLYPGAGADTTDHRYRKFYPKYRFSQVIRNCDSHHNTGGFSGTNSHGTLITHNNFYDNALGYTTDVFTAAGHPGFPQHGNVVTHNNFYSNNFNPYVSSSDVEPFIPAPVGTGLWLAGGNANVVSKNHFYDNWRRGAMLFAVPDATVCGPPPVGSSTPVPGCNPTGTSTSYGNRFSHNTMGISPMKRVLPNGVDFWWDSFPGNTGNCWWGNRAPSGRSVTSSPASLPGCNGGTSPGSSMGLGDPVNEMELLSCFVGFTVGSYPEGDPNTCTWTKTPPRPGGSGRTTNPAVAPDVSVLSDICSAGLSLRLCSAYWHPVLPVVTTEQTQRSATRPADAGSRPLSLYTCDWWRKADDGERLGMVRRIQHLDTLPVYGSTGRPYGHGAGLSDVRATRLLQGRCSTTGAGPFALYKLYAAAAAFAAVMN